MSALHIHAGLPKTGTTALQRFLMLNRERLEARGLHLADIGYEAARGNHHDLAQGLGSLNPMARRSVLRDLRPNPASETLISSEFVFLMCRYARGAHGLRALARKGFHLKFYLFVRPQPDFAVSAYPEVLRNLLLPQSFEAFLAHVFPKLGGDLLDIAEMFEALSPGNLRVLPYSAAARARGVWWDLLEAMGHPVESADREGFASPGDVNLSLDAVGVAALQASLERIEAAGAVRRWSRRRRLREVVLRASEEIKGGDMPYNPLSQDARRRLWEASLPGNDALAQKYWGESWDTVFAAEKVASPDLSLFDPASSTPAQRARFEAHREVLMDVLLTKIARMKSRARQRPLGLIAYPLDYAGDRLLRARVAGR